MPTGIYKRTLKHVENMSLAQQDKKYTKETNLKKGSKLYKHWNWKGGKSKCIDCGNILSRKKYKRCIKCSNKLDYNANWRGGKSFEPYPLGWNESYKEQIRYRDNYKCQNPECGVLEVACNRKLDVHHIDYNKSNLNPNNLISLCKSCHSKTNFNRDYWKRFFNK